MDSPPGGKSAWQRFLLSGKEADASFQSRLRRWRIACGQRCQIKRAAIGAAQGQGQIRVRDVRFGELRDHRAQCRCVGLRRAIGTAQIHEGIGDELAELLHLRSCQMHIVAIAQTVLDKIALSMTAVGRVGDGAILCDVPAAEAAQLVVDCGGVRIGLAGPKGGFDGRQCDQKPRRLRAHLGLFKGVDLLKMLGVIGDIGVREVGLGSWRAGIGFALPPDFRLIAQRGRQACKRLAQMASSVDLVLPDLSGKAWTEGVDMLSGGGRFGQQERARRFPKRACVKGCGEADGWACATAAATRREAALTVAALLPSDGFTCCGEHVWQGFHCWRGGACAGGDRELGDVPIKAPGRGRQAVDGIEAHDVGLPFRIEKSDEAWLR